MDTIKLRQDYLPPKEFLPQVCKLLPGLEYPESLNLAEELLDRNLAERGDKVAIHHENGRITYFELVAEVNRFANALRDLGIGKGDRVVLRAVNIPEYIVWNFACWRVGAIPVLVSHLNRAPELAFKINDSGAVAICVDAASYGDVDEARTNCPDLQHVIVHGASMPGTLSYADLVAGKFAEAVSEKTSPKNFARIIYSSGTTGKPKGILTTIEGILSICDTHGRHVLGIRPDDVLGGHPYFSFAFGAGSFLYLPWRFGASISIISAFSAERQFELIDEHGITLLFAVPTAFRMMLGVPDAERRYRLSTLRLCQSAGEPLPVTTIREWRARFGHVILNSVGSGELHYWLTTTENMPDEKIGSSGLAVPGYEAVVVDENLNPLPSGMPGELLVRGPVGQLYWRRPDSQQKGVCPPDSRYAGWSRPGLVCVEDSDGYFWYKSRSDDMIVTSGYKVPGGEVEVALSGHPAVVESAVVGVPDKERGNVIKAFVVLKDGVEPSAQLVRELQDFVKRELEPYKYPRLIEFTTADMFPRTATGKIQRNALRDREIAASEAVSSSTDAPSAATAGEPARQAPVCGSCCAESAALALANAQGLDSSSVVRQVGAFCSGMAQIGGPCGALTGAILGLNLAMEQGKAGESPGKALAATQRLVLEFEGEFGGRHCHELLDCDPATPEGQAEFRERRLHERCAQYAARAAELAASLIAASGSR